MTRRDSRFEVRSMSWSPRRAPSNLARSSRLLPFGSTRKSSLARDYRKGADSRGVAFF
jgi:hypothetical protein